MSAYAFTIQFNTDRELTEDEKSAIIDSLYLQIKEPMDYDNEDLDVTTSRIMISESGLIIQEGEF